MFIEARAAIESAKECRVLPGLQGYLDQVNEHIASTSSANGVSYAKVYLAFNGVNGDEDPGAKGYLSFDGLHPNDTGHKVIAGELRKLGYAPLR